MSRSKKKTPVTGMTTARSEKEDKRHANRILRRVSKPDPENAPALREVSDVWGMAKDGKVRFDPTDKAGRKLMRK